MYALANGFNRRNFIKTATAGSLYVVAEKYRSLGNGYFTDRPVRIGFVGVGSRGTGMLKVALSLDGVEVPAVCDIVEEKVENAQRLVEEAGQPKPKGYTGAEGYNKLVDLKDIDAVFTATPWHLHTPVMVAAMKSGKYGATEVPACDGYDQTWELVETSEQTGIPCMMMENSTYRRNVMMILNMVRKGMFGDISHCETGYQHDTRYVTIGPKGELLWRAYERALNNNGNRYPTHGIGPASQWTNINRGNKFEYLVSMSSRSLGLNYYASKKFGADHPTAKMDFALGDVNTSLIQTNNGVTITLYYDPQTPRPYDLILRIQGTKGIYSGTLDKIHLEDLSPQAHQWEDVDKYLKEYDHPLWKEHGAKAESSGHGGSDYLCFRDFAEAVRNRTEVPIDVYDAASWSIITKLTEESVNNKSRPVDFPDFTKGKWQSRKPRSI